MAIPELAVEEGDGFCPECGQSLDLTRYQGQSPERRTGESPLLILCGLLLIALLGVQVWHTHLAIVEMDRQIREAESIPGGFYPARLDQMVMRHQDARLRLERKLNQEDAGLILGVAAVVLGGSRILRQHWASAEEQAIRKVESSASPFPGWLLPLSFQLWEGGEALGISFIRAVLIVFGVAVLGQLAYGVPVSLSLVDQAVKGTIDVIVAIGRMAP